MAKVIRYCKLEEEHYGDNVFDVSRPNIFGNPYTHIKNKETKAQIKVNTREEAINLYGHYFNAMLKSDDEVGDAFRAEWERMYDAYKKYDVIYLGCYCKLDEDCHGDIIRKKLIQRSMKEKMREILKQRANKESLQKKDSPQATE